jgi:hypothetical protein
MGGAGNETGGQDAEAAALAESEALGWRDDVALQRALQHQHPDLDIDRDPERNPVWLATWRGGDGTQQRAGADRLRLLLDKVAPILAARLAAQEQS